MLKLPNIATLQPKTDYNDYQPSETEQALIAMVLSRFQDMKTYRANFDKARDIYNDMIEAILKPYGDDRSKSAVPLISALTELFVAEATKINTQFNIKSELNKYSNQAKALDFVWKYDWRKNNRKREITDNEYITAWF